MMAFKDDAVDSSEVDFADSESRKHIAELLEITGAPKINEAVKLQVEVMKVQTLSKVATLINRAKKAGSLAETDTEQKDDDKSFHGSLATTIAIGKLKSRAAKVRSSRASTADCLPARFFYL